MVRGRWSVPGNHESAALESPFDVDHDSRVSRTRPARSSPTFMQPMAARVVTKLPEGTDWSYEVKFDGYRALLLKDGERLQIRSRNDKDMTLTYPSVAAAGRCLVARQAVVDGEIVAVDANGRPSFQALQHRGAHSGTPSFSTRSTSSFSMASTSPGWHSTSAERSCLAC